MIRIHCLGFRRFGKTVRRGLPRQVYHVLIFVRCMFLIAGPVKVTTHPAGTSPTTSIPSRSSTSTHSKSRSPQEFSPPQQKQSPGETNPQDPFADLFTSSSENEDQDPKPIKQSPDSTSLSTFLTSPSTVTSTSPLPTPASFEDRTTNRDTESYFSFFLSELSKCFPYVNLFPWTAATLFSSSNHNPALRQSVLAVAALINKSQGQQEALDHLQRALQLIRDKISSVEVDEGIAISSFLLSHFSMMLGDYVTAKKHLKGMLVVLQRLDHYHGGVGGRGGENREGGGGGGREGVPNPLRMDELTMLIWRMAIRIDFISSIASGKAPILPEYFPRKSPEIPPNISPPSLENFLPTSPSTQNDPVPPLPFPSPASHSLIR